MAAISITASLDTMIREELPILFMESLPKIDPFFTSVYRTSQQVKRDDIGQGWKVMHRFRTSLSGQYQPANLNANQTTAAALKQVMGYGTLASFPNPSKTPHKGSMVRTCALGCHRGNFGLPAFVLKASALSDIVLKDIADDLKGTAELRAQWEAVSLYMPTTACIGSFDDGTLADSNTRLDVTPDSSRIRWFRPGMLIDLYDDTSFTNQKNVDDDDASVIPLVVDAVDYLGGTISLRSMDGDYLSHGGGAGYMADNLTSGTYYMFSKGLTAGGTLYRAGHWGFEDWMKSSGQIMDATMQGRLDSSSATFSLTTYPQFKSYVISDLAGPLTDTYLTAVIGKFLDDYGASLDTMVTTRRVVQKYLDSPNLGNNRFMWDRSGKPLSVVGGWNDVAYEYEGKRFKVHISPYCASGKMYVCKTGEGNIKRYVPPRSVGVGGIGSPGTGMEMGEEVEFFAPLGGSTNIFKHVHNSSGETTPMVEAPFEQYSQVIPEDVRGIVIGGITESTEIS